MARSTASKGKTRRIRKGNHLKEAESTAVPVPTPVPARARAPTVTSTQTMEQAPIARTLDTTDIHLVTVVPVLIIDTRNSITSTTVLKCFSLPKGGHYLGTDTLMAMSPSFRVPLQLQCRLYIRDRWMVPFWPS